MSATAANGNRFGKYGVHLMEASWREKGNFVSRKAALLWENHLRPPSAHAEPGQRQTRALPLANPA